MIRNFFKRLLARIPEELPKDSKSIDRFVSQVLSTYNLPDSPEYQSAVVKAIHGLSQSTHRAPKSYFYSHLARFEAMRAAVVKVTELEKAKQAATLNKGNAAEPLQDACIQATSTGMGRQA